MFFLLLLLLLFWNEQVWDVTAGKRLHTLEGHTARVGALAWNGDLLASGSRDRLILQRDIRTPPSIATRKLSGHRQEVGPPPPPPPTPFWAWIFLGRTGVRLG